MPPTTPLYQTDSSRHEATTKLTSIQPLSSFPIGHFGLFKSVSPQPDDLVIQLESTIFHPQGGGQPSDTGTITFSTAYEPNDLPDEETKETYQVLLVRKFGNEILHLARAKGSPYASPLPGSDTTLTLHLNVPARVLHSRIHTAGHLLGLSMHTLATSSSLPAIEDGKAQHFPGPNGAWVECTTEAVLADHKEELETLTNKLVEERRKVWVEEMGVKEAEGKCVGGLGGMNVADGEKVRVVMVEGMGGYPCGGTHLPSSRDVGEVKVGKISKRKGVTKVGYALADESSSKA